MTYQEKVHRIAKDLFMNPDNYKEFLRKEEAKTARYQATKKRK